MAERLVSRIRSPEEYEEANLLTFTCDGEEERFPIVFYLEQMDEGRD